MKRRTIASTAKWGLTGAAVVIAVVWVGSYWWWLTWMPESIRKFAVVARGTFAKHEASMDVLFASTPSVRWPPALQIHAAERQRYPSAWFLARRRDWSGDWLFVPLWVPLVLTALPAGLLWRADWRRRAGIKRGGCVGCGYDRSGLGAEVVCPECGRAPGPEQPQP